MKLDKTTLRRLIKEELTREVEEAQLDEIGGHGSAAGRAEADERFDAAIAYLQQLIAGGAKGLEGAVAALRGGGEPGDTWHGSMNVGSPDAHMGEGEVETNEDPLAEAGSSDQDGSGETLDETDIKAKGAEGGAAAKRQSKPSTESMSKMSGPSNARRVKVESEEGHHEDEVIDEDEEGIDEEDLDETHYTLNFNKAGQTTRHRSPAGARPATSRSTMSVSSRLPRTQSEGVDRPGSLLEALEERIENLSEVNSVPVHEPDAGGFCPDRLGTLCGIKED